MSEQGIKRRKVRKTARKAIKPTPKRKVSPQRQIKALRLKLWELCKQITRKRYQKPNGTWICYTCDRLIDIPAKAHTGHGIPSSVGGISCRFHLDNLRIQDYYCNINLGGNGSEFYRRLVEEIGQKRVDDLFILKNKVAKADIIFYMNKVEEYTELLKSL